MIKGQDIIIMGIQPWDIEIGSNCKNIAAEFAKENRVLYVNPPLDSITKFKYKKQEKIQKRIQIAKGNSQDIEKISHNLWTFYPKTTIDSINWISIPNVFNFFNKRNTKLFATDIQSAIARLGFSNYILFNDSSMFLGLHIKEMLQPKVYVYYMRDYLVKVPYWQKHGERIEPQVVKKADVVVTNSDFFAELCTPINAHSYMVGQGCNVSHFNDSNNDLIVPKEFENIPNPVVGYIGSLTSLRLNISLLESIAKTRKDWSLVLVGPEDEDFKKSSLHQLLNVYFLGSKNESELPNYLKGFDVAINPQLENNLTIGNYPRKIDEYLAMGKPVVATKTKAMEMFQNYVYQSSSTEEYISLIEKALSKNTSQLVQERKTFANSHTWENNVMNIYNAILKASKK